MKLKINIGFLGLLAILFVALKLTHFIAWSWLWVLSPLWIGFAVTGLIWTGFFIFSAIVFVFAVLFGSRR